MHDPVLRTDGVRFVRHRGCPARAGYVELIVDMDGNRFSWCLPEPVLDPGPPAADQIELLRHRSGVQLVARLADGSAAVVDVRQAVAALTAEPPARLVVDVRLMPLHA
jgi:hypothetical protein